MKSAFITTCFLAGSTFSTGYGTWWPGVGGMASLSRDEQQYVNDVNQQLKACSDVSCKEAVSSAMIMVINDRRSLDSMVNSSIVFDYIRQPCEALVKDVLLQAPCFDRLSKMSYQELMIAAGFRKSGISSSGYGQIRTGMRLRDVEFVLAASGDEQSYSAYGGYSAAVYRWQRGSTAVIVTFSNDFVSAKSQIGLR